MYIWGGSFESVGDVTFGSASGGSGGIDIIIGQTSAGFSSPVDGLGSVDATTTFLPVRLSYFINKDTGPLQVNYILSGYTGRELIGSITILSRSGVTPGIFNLNVGSGTYTGVISGDIDCSAGNITTVNTYSTGIIRKSDGSAVTLRAANFNGFITSGTVNANFYGPSGGSWPSFRKLTVGTGNLSGNIDIAGFVNTSGNGIYVTGSGAVMDATIRVQQSLPSNVHIEVPSGGMEGQVIINADGSSYLWSGTVKVGGTTLSGPYYTDSSASLGGGAVGLVPFHMHLTDCDPPHSPDGACDFTIHTQTWPGSFNSHGGTATTRDTIVVRFYGPVFDSADGSPDSPSTKPLVIELKSVAICYPTPCGGDITTWTDMSGNFDVYCPGNAAADGSREVWVSRVLDGSGNPQDFFGWQYGVRLTPKVVSSHTELRSDKTFADPAPDVAGTYIFWPFCNESRSDGGDSGIVYLDSSDD